MILASGKEAKDGYIDWDVWCVDGSNVRASRAAAGSSS